MLALKGEHATPPNEWPAERTLLGYSCDEIDHSIVNTNWNRAIGQRLGVIADVGIEPKFKGRCDAGFKVRDCDTSWCGFMVRCADSASASEIGAEMRVGVNAFVGNEQRSKRPIRNREQIESLSFQHQQAGIVHELNWSHIVGVRDAV